MNFSEFQNQLYTCSIDYVHGGASFLFHGPHIGYTCTDNKKDGKRRHLDRFLPPAPRKSAILKGFKNPQKIYKRWFASFLAEKGYYIFKTVSSLDIKDT